MNKSLISFLLGYIAFTLSIYAQTPIRYQVVLSDIVHHEINIRVDFTNLPDSLLVLKMPSASPGRYALHNFAKNIYQLKAFDRSGDPLIMVTADLAEWHVSTPDGFARIEYTLFANHANGTYSGIDNRKVHLNMPATFLYGEGLEDRPIELSFDLRSQSDWSIATQLGRIGKNRFRASNYYYFFDSPVLIGDLDKRSWTTNSNGKEYLFEMAVLHEGTSEELDDYAEWVKEVVEIEKQIFGSLPEFDLGRYTFLISYNPWVYGDGMEHRNSTFCTSTGNLEEHAAQLIGTVAHEFFHAWNVERIRPRSLEPFEFDHPNQSGELWFGEGFTAYYTSLVLCRAGILSPEDYIKRLSSGLNAVINSPARAFRNPIEMSLMAPYVDAATSTDEFNKANTFISYYTYGSVLGLILDLQLRSTFDKVTLDDFMQLLWKKFGQQEIPYTISDLQRALAEVTDDPNFASVFFNKYIYKSELPDMKALLQQFGVALEYRNPGKFKNLGLGIEYTDEGARIDQQVLKGTPFYEAGLTKGDYILEINGQQLTKESGFLKDLAIGQSHLIKFRQNGIVKESFFTAVLDPSLNTSLIEKPDPKAKEQRDQWLWK